VRHLVRVLNPQDPLGAQFAGKEVVVECCSETSQVQVACRRGSEAEFRGSD